MTKTFTLTLVLSVFCILSGFSQNYQVFNSGDTKLYEQNQNSDIRAIRVDSTAFQDGDSIFYFNSTARQVEFSCFTLNGSSWMGNHVRIKSDGTSLFFNSEGDTISIETQAEVDAPWTCFEKDEISITATVINTSTQELFGQTTSVKTIGFEAFDMEGNSASGPINDKTIELSEDFGLNQALNFYAFPDSFELYYEVPFSEYSLKGSESPELGIQNLTNREVFDFQPGDELHVIERDISPGNGNRIELAFEFTGRENYADSIVYDYQRHYFNYSLPEDSLIAVYVTPETLTVKNEAEINALPSISFLDSSSYLAPVVIRHYNMQLSNIFDMSNLRTKTSTEDYYSLVINENPDCWTEPIIDGCFSEDSYYEGLGGPYYYCSSSIAEQYISERALVYFNKGGTEWGTPLDLTVGIDDLGTKETAVKVFPNPAENFLKFEVSSGILPLKVELYNLAGQLVKSAMIRTSGQRIDIENMADGMYSYQVSGANGLVGSGKVAVR
jgi:hypothetical protein